jgi:hypothetical protein
VGPGSSKPQFAGVLDLGLRDVGVENQPRRMAGQFGKTYVKVLFFVVVAFFVTCATLGATGARWAALPAAAMLTAGSLFIVIRAVKRSPLTVVRVNADGRNQATWVLIAMMKTIAVAAVVVGGLLGLPIVAFALFMSFYAWRARGRMPTLLRGLRPLLAPGETVLGDVAGRFKGVWRWHEGFRLVLATDARLLIVGATRSAQPTILADLSYARISGYAVEWLYGGRFGRLTLTVDADGDAPPVTHTISDTNPANLVSVLEALDAHGVAAEDPAVAAEATRLWDEARTGARGTAPHAPAAQAKRPLFDRVAMNTPDFDRGLWLLLAVVGAFLYIPHSSLGVDAGSTAVALVGFVVIPVICAVCGYVARTRSALAYLVPLNLLLTPGFFYTDADDTVVLMVVLSVLAAAGLSIGARLRAAKDPAPPAPDPTRPARGSLRYTLSGVSLVRLTGILLGLMLVAVASASAAGIELPTLRMALDEFRAKQVAVDGRSNLTGGAASVRYTRGPDLREFILDGAGAGQPPYDGAQWELRSSFRKGYNVVSLGHLVQDPPLDDPAAIAAFVERKDREHADLAGEDVSHTTRVVDGRRGYVWNHSSSRDYWYYAAWFPHPEHTVRVECIARRQKERFQRLCAEALDSLEFRDER